MTRVLITGGAGQLGAELARASWPESDQILAVARAELDITDPGAIDQVVERLRPDVIINAAAYTAVDRAEEEPDLAQAVNATAVGYLATAAAEMDARLIHISTDYVFDGTKDGWYTEDDPVAPLGVYGSTKAAGEEMARMAPRHLILRTAWVYGALGSNFVATMLRLAGTRDELSVVDDQIGCPTATSDLSLAIIELVDDDPSDELTGTFHLASPVSATWYEFARAILADKLDEGLKINPISTDEYPTPAARPANSRLDSSALEAARGIRLPSWHDSMPAVLAELDGKSDRLEPT